MTTTKTYKIEGMDCESCAKLIELDLEEQGLKCKCSFAKQTLEVESKHDKSAVEEIVKRSGYSLS